MVRRTHGGASAPQGHWWTTEAIDDAGASREGLSLPAGNLATDVSEGVIPKGTTIYIGQAQGGWTQIFVDRSRDVIIGPTRTLK
jgi:hypothetical protein